MDALQNLHENIPDWIKKLDELNGQIAQRQIELAAVDDARPGTSASGATRSVKNKGSTESLKPQGEPAAHPHEPVADEEGPRPEVLRQAAAIKATKQAGATHARKTLGTRQRTDSMMTAEGAPKYRTRTMIMVYYDSYVQTFFKDLADFLAQNRNMMRKAKMAAKVDRVRRFARVDLADDQQPEGDLAGPNAQAIMVQTSVHLNSSGPSATNLAGGAAPIETTAAQEGVGDDQDLPAWQYVGRMPPNAAPSSGPPTIRRAGDAGSGRGLGIFGGDDPDIWDDLDKGLDYVQNMCVHAAHQFLRDGHCAEEVANIERRLTETKDMADREMARLESIKAVEENTKNRVRRLQEAKVMDVQAPAAEGPSVPDLATDILEVDDAIDAIDDEEPIPTLLYRSTRRMRRVDH